VILSLQRFHDSGQSTLGLLSVNDQFLCFTLEDEGREIKVKGETRIPAGRYQIKLRAEGGNAPEVPEVPLSRRYAVAPECSGF